MVYFSAKEPSNIDRTLSLPVASVVSLKSKARLNIDTMHAMPKFGKKSANPY